MELVFDNLQTIVAGNDADIIHTWDDQVNLLYLDDYSEAINSIEMFSKNADKKSSEWGALEFDRAKEIFFSEDAAVNINGLYNFRIENFGSWGAIGTLKLHKENNDQEHKLLIYEYQVDVTKKLESGRIKMSNDTPISSFNIKLNSVESPEKFSIRELGTDYAILTPGAKVIFKFGMGSALPTYDMGTYYIDRSNINERTGMATIDGRNLIGKVLKDQTFDENNSYPNTWVGDNLEMILLNAGLRPDQFEVQVSSFKMAADFRPNTNLLTGIDEMLQVVSTSSAGTFRIEERTDGKILIGESLFPAFDKRETFMFDRQKDLFSSKMILDDQQIYSKVCAHTSDFSIATYIDVRTYQGWNLQTNKTMYVEVPDGLREVDVISIAFNVADRLRNVGKVESFTGPFRPHLLVGDAAKVVKEDFGTDIGLITEISHSFGKGGFLTDFTVDSGGKLGVGKLSDYISLLGVAKPNSNLVYEQG